MWDTNILKKIENISNGIGCDEREQYLLNNCMSFYASDEYGDHYCVGYNTILNYYTGKKHNPFTWIGYILYDERGYMTVYKKGE